MKNMDMPRKLICLCLMMVLALTTSGALASAQPLSDDALDQAMQADKPALTPLDLGAMGNYVPLSLSPDGTRLLALQESNLAILSLNDGGAQFLGLSPEIAEMEGGADQPTDWTDAVAWSADGTRLAFVGESGMLWLADLAAGTMRPVGDPRIATEENPEFFSAVSSAVFAPDYPVLYFLVEPARSAGLLSRLLPSNTLIYRYTYDSHATAMIESANLHGASVGPLHFDGQALTMLAHNNTKTELLAWTHMQSLQSLELPVPEASMAGENASSSIAAYAQVADTHGGTAALIVPTASGSTGIMMVPLPKEPVDIDVDQENIFKQLNVSTPTGTSFGEPALLSGEWLLPEMPPFTPKDAAFSPDGRYLAVLGASGEQLALYIVDPTTGAGNAVELPATAVAPDASVFSIQWSANGTFLLDTGDAAAVYTLY